MTDDPGGSPPVPVPPLPVPPEPDEPEPPEDPDVPEVPDPDPDWIVPGLAAVLGNTTGITLSVLPRTVTVVFAVAHVLLTTPSHTTPNSVERTSAGVCTVPPVPPTTNRSDDGPKTAQRDVFTLDHESRVDFPESTVEDAATRDTIGFGFCAGGVVVEGVVEAVSGHGYAGL